MKSFKILFVCLLMTLGFLLLSCAPMWTIQFDLDVEFESSKLKGWILESNLHSAKNTIIEEERYHILDEYMMKLKFDIPDKKRISTFYDIDIDSLKIIMQNNGDTVFIKHNNYFYSGANRKWMSKAITFLPKDVREPEPNKFYDLHIPEEIDSLVLQFDVILREAEYFSYLPFDSEIPRDSLRIIESKEPIIIPMKLKLHKYVLKM